MHMVICPRPVISFFNNLEDVGMVFSEYTRLFFYVFHSANTFFLLNNFLFFLTEIVILQAIWLLTDN